MARYRKGDRYLSEGEYQEEQQNNWIFFLFLIGAVVSGYLAHSGIVDFDLPKWARFIVVTIAGIVGGGIAGALHKQIQLLLGLAFISGIVFVIAMIVWDMV